MPVQEQLNIIFQLLQAGRSIPIEEVIEIAPDVAGTGLVTQGTSEVAVLGNGTATEVTSLVVDSTATEVSTAGVGLLALDVGVAGAAIAPALGILAGVGLYNLAPEFWTNVSNDLLEAGQTIGGKVRAFLNPVTKQLGLAKETIEIFKMHFIQAGIFEEDIDFPEIKSAVSISIGGTNTDFRASDYNAVNKSYQPYVWGIRGTVSIATKCTLYLYSKPNERLTGSTKIVLIGWDNGTQATVYHFIDFTKVANHFNITDDTFLGFYIFENALGEVLSSGPTSVQKCVFGNVIKYIARTFITLNKDSSPNLYNYFKPFLNSVELNSIQQQVGFPAWFNMFNNNANLQPDATYPDERPIPEIYPAWNPWSVPVEGFPDVYPIEIPAINPNPDQQQAQFPQEIPDNDPNALDWLIETLPQPDPNPNPYPEPAPNPDPDPAPEPEPIPEPEPEPTPDNPVDPNPTPTPSPLPVVPDMPETVESNAMFTVYKPSMAQVNAFGGWLWSSSIVEAIKRIWQNPLDGIISFMKVYVDAPTSGSDTIKVGILDSEVSSPVVSGQFVTVECGSLNVREKFYNATDYSPFVGMHLYLPFIGIVELDIDEFMSGEIKVTYHVDVYTGTCLAEVKSRRSPDMPEWTIVYTFSGNASQQLPLTSAEFSGALSSLVGVVGGGLAIASGGGLGLLAGASGIAHAVSHEMVHLAHSGSLSANAGIMGARKPFLILTRRRSYDANGYNELYGYPSNKTVYLNNCSGYVKVKDIRLETSATEDERLEIENLLKSGAII